MGDNFYEVWLYARRATARVRFLHGGSQSIVLPEIFSGKSINLEPLNLEPLRKPRKKSSARILSFRNKIDERARLQTSKRFERKARKKTRHKKTL